MIKYQHFALDNLFLTNGYLETHTEYGIEREYECEDELEQCIRRLVLRKPEPLRGWDLRFLRRGLELSQTDFGKTIDRDSQTVARWEKSVEPIPKFVDLMIRARFAERFEPQIKLRELLGFVDGISSALPAYIQLSLTVNGWDFNYGLRTDIPLTRGLLTSLAGLPYTHGPVQVVSEKVLEQSDHFSSLLVLCTPHATKSNIEHSFRSSMSTKFTVAMQVPALAETSYSRILQ